MRPEWAGLPAERQIEAAGSALRLATDMLAQRAEALAGEFDAGSVPDMGGAEALRLLAMLVRLREPADPRRSFANAPAAGHA